MFHYRYIVLFAAIFALAFNILLPDIAEGSYRWEWYENTNIAGGDYKDTNLSSPKAHLCEKKCKRDKKCRAWTYVKPGVQGSLARCWLKLRSHGRENNNCCTSGERVSVKPVQASTVTAREIEEGYDRPGGDYKSFMIQSNRMSTCQTECQKDRKCVAWTYMKPGVQAALAKCWLKTSAPKKKRDSCCTSGVILHRLNR